MDGETEVEGMSCHGGSDVAARGSASFELLPPARDQSLRPQAVRHGCLNA